jgi:hypothetical protein
VSFIFPFGSSASTVRRFVRPPPIGPGFLLMRVGSSVLSSSWTVEFSQWTTYKMKLRTPTCSGQSRYSSHRFVAVSWYGTTSFGNKGFATGLAGLGWGLAPAAGFGFGNDDLGSDLGLDAWLTRVGSSDLIACTAIRSIASWLSRLEKISQEFPLNLSVNEHCVGDDPCLRNQDGLYNE